VVDSGREESTQRPDSRESLRDSRRSAEHERELVIAASAGDEAASRELVEAFLPAIASVRRRLDVDGRVLRAELMQEGVAGLLFAARRYDPRLGTPFWPYASFWVRKAMQDLVADVTRPAALSDHAVRGLARIRAARRDHLQSHHSEPTRAELALATGFNEPQLESLLAVERTPRSLEEPVGGEDSTTPLRETVPDPRAESEYDQVLERLVIRQVRDLAKGLDQRERTVLWSHYGLGRRPQTLREIGARLGLTSERARQIEEGALKKLREAAVEPASR
jgi:RNA polymerase primary sigma factor